jgi:hypothetical protein
MARLKTEIRAAALIRRAHSAGAFAVVLRRGDPDAGALWVILRYGQKLMRYSEQMSLSGGQAWFEDGPYEESDLNLKTNKAVDRDPDLWVVEIEDAKGRAFLDGEIATQQTQGAADAAAAAKALFRDR